MIRSTIRRGLSVAVVAALALAACGGDDDDAAADEPETTEAVAAEEETTTTTEATTTTMSAEEAEATISEKTTEFFRLIGEGDHESAVALLENGSEYLDELAHCEELVTGAAVEMQSVTVDGQTASTLFDILINGAVVLEGSGGTAVLTDGEWLVGENTFLSLYDAAKEGCTGPPPAEA